MEERILPPSLSLQDAANLDNPNDKYESATLFRPRNSETGSGKRLILKIRNLPTRPQDLTFQEDKRISNSSKNNHKPAGNLIAREMSCECSYQQDFHPINTGRLRNEYGSETILRPPDWMAHKGECSGRRQSESCLDVLTSEDVGNNLHLLPHTTARDVSAATFNLIDPGARQGADPSGITNFGGAYQSTKTGTDEPHPSEHRYQPQEVIDLCSSSPPLHTQSPPICSVPQPIPQHLHSLSSNAPSTFSLGPLRVLRQDPQSASARDADGFFYPSPYTSVQPSILTYDTAKARKGTSQTPTCKVTAKARYTSVLEHDLAATKTQLARANQMMLVLEQENKVLERRLAGRQ